MTNIRIAQAKKTLHVLINDAVTKHKIFNIHNRQEEVVLMSKEEYESISETIHLMSIPGFMKSIERSKKQIKKGETFSIGEVFKQKK